MDKLVEKYWAGETNLEEEKLIKDHFWQKSDNSQEGLYFRFLAKAKQQKAELPDQKLAPKTSRLQSWLPAAATVIIGIFAAVLVFSKMQRDPFAEEDPEKALQITKKALLMIGGGLNEGQSHAMELSKFNKVNEKLKKDPDESN
ncbi:MAG: hypothetical protein AAF616_14300 [Bacteroidota bacterium]